MLIKNMSKLSLSMVGGGMMVAVGLLAVTSIALAAVPSVVSVKLTGPNVLTVVYSEPVTTNSWDYTNFTGNLAGFGVVSISGSGSSVITLTLNGDPSISTGASGYLTIGTGVVSISTSSAFPGGAYNVTSAQPPVLSSVSVTVSNTGGGSAFTTIGSQIMLTFSTNEPVVNPTVTILGHTIGVSGTGSGPYSVPYTLVNGDAQGTINATILFTDMNGNSGSATVNVLSNSAGSTNSVGGSITSNANTPGTLYAGNPIVFTLVPSTPEPNARSVTGSYNGVPLSWYTSNGGATYTATYTVMAGQSNTTYPLQISGVSLVDQYGNTIGPFAGSDVEKTITASAVVGPITIYQATPVTASAANLTPSYGFVSTEAGAIHYGGDCSSPTTAASAGLNTVTFNALSQGTHGNCTITVTDSAGNVSNQLVVSPFTVGAATPVAAVASSSSDLTTQLQSLQSQLAQLQSQANGSNSGSASTAVNFTEFLSVGSQDAQVSALQQRLTTDGFYSGPITGFYGTLTKAAVKKFQSAHAIATKGYVGPSTRTALNAGE
jgi:hypothetical protein